MPQAEPEPAPSATTVGLLLGSVGLVAFGGPAAHVALMRRQVVERRRWLAAEVFDGMFAACNLVPGPSSTELAVFVGYRLAGWPGLALAAVSFIGPASVLMLALAVLYDRYAGSRAVQALLYGVRPVVVAIMAWAALDLARKLVRRRALLLVIAPALVLYFLGINPVLVLALCALAGWGGWHLRKSPAAPLANAWLLGPHPERLLALFLSFLKLGAVSFGSGYVLFAFLDSDFVRGLHWLRPAQLVDAVALGQVTPGPVFTTATFLGYLFAGLPGAVLATVAIFLPGLLLVPLLDRAVRLVDSRPALRLSLDAVNAAVVGLIAAAAIELGRASVVDGLTPLIAGAALLLVVWRPLASPLAVFAGAAAGLLARGAL